MKRTGWLWFSGSMKTLLQVLVLLGLTGVLLGSAFYDFRGSKALPLIATLLCGALICIVCRAHLRRGKTEFASFVIAMVSSVVGAGLVVVAIKVSALNWIVDGPGWLVSRFTSIDFHEGEGAFGFLLSFFLAWLTCSAVTWLSIYGVKRIAQTARTRE
jgi:hypothetical protein